MKIESLKCAAAPVYFVHRYCQLYDGAAGRWAPFHLWPAQLAALEGLNKGRLTLILKARQLGLTWLSLAYALWTLLFRPGSSVLLFSRRDDEAVALLARLRGMYRRLPPWLQPTIGRDNEHELAFERLNSCVRTFPTTKHSGRSYTATLAIIDEADFIPWFRELLNAVKPTIDAGGQLIALSTADRGRPASFFKQLWTRANDSGDCGGYQALFLPWWAHPGRDAAWYQRMAAEMAADDLRQEYPATPEEALAPRQAAARFDIRHLQSCHQPAGPIDTAPPTPIPGLTVYEAPVAEGGRYLIAADPAEGDPGSDPSPALVFDVEHWAEVACLQGRFEPTTLADYLAILADWYNGAVICPERNNHGHAVLVALEQHDSRPAIYRSPFDKKLGWLSSAKYRVMFGCGDTQPLPA